MKPIVVVLIALILQAINSNASAQSWAIAQSKNPTNGHVIVFRYMDIFPPAFNRANQATRAVVVWRYQTETGMPMQSERKQMDAFEDLLEPALEKSGIATLALVSTGEGLREWTYYAKSEELFFQQLNNALKTHAKFPVEIHVGQDPTWSTYDQFVKQVKKP
jgi:hypothetical protein